MVEVKAFRINALHIEVLLNPLIIGIYFKKYNLNKPKNFINKMSTDQIKTIEIKELDVDIIPPTTSRINEPDYGGSKIVVIGKPGTGKTTLIASLLYAKKHIFPVGMFMSGSEDSNGFYRKIIPSTFVFNEYSEQKLDDFRKRQKIAKQYLNNPWAVVLLDDCTDDPRIFNKPLQQGFYKRGRHWKMWYILSLQYAMDVSYLTLTLSAN
jgi:hypothetical protein